MYINDNILDQFKPILSNNDELLYFETNNLIIRLNLKIFYIDAEIYINDYKMNFEKTCSNYAETIEFINKIIDCIDSDADITNQNIENLK